MSATTSVPGVLVANAQLMHSTYAQVKEEADKAAQRRRAGQGKRALQSASCMSRLKNRQVVDLRAFDNDGMVEGVGQAAEEQCAKSLPMTTLAVLKANAEAEVNMVHQDERWELSDCRDEAERSEVERATTGPSYGSVVPTLVALDADRARDRAKLQERKEIRTVESQKFALRRIRERNDEKWKAASHRVSQHAITFNFDAVQLSADQRWEGIQAPSERAHEMSVAPEDPGPAAAPRPRVAGIEPFFKYGYLPPLHRLYLQRVSSFYTDRMLKRVLVPLVNQEDETALRQLDWLVTNYCKEHNLCVVGLDDKQRHVHTWYVALREALRKRHFEPFGKKWRVAFCSGGKIYRTTAGQAVFLMEAYNAGVLQYAKGHCAEIDLHLRRQHRRRDKRKSRCQGQYRRAPLTKACPMTTTIVKEMESAVEDLEIGEDDEFLEWMDAHRRSKRANSARTRAFSRPAS